MGVFQILTNALYIYYVLDITFLSISIAQDKFNKPIFRYLHWIFINIEAWNQINSMKSTALKFY